jgi:hypothetical protein
MSISPDVIVAELKKDPTYGKPEMFTPQLQAFARLLPLILEKQLQLKVTAQVFFHVRRLVTIAAMDAALIYTSHKKLEDVVATLAEWERNPRLAFQDAGVRNERKYMLGSTVNLNDLLQTFYKDGELTVAEILRHQPGLLFA